MVLTAFRFILNQKIIFCFLLLFASAANSEVIIKDNFDDEMTEWSFWANSNNGSSGEFVHDYVSPLDNGDKIARINVTDGGLNAYDVQLLQSGFPLSAGEYHIAFSAWLDQGSDQIEVQLHEHAAPYANYGRKSIVLTDEPQSFILSVSLDNDEPNARLRFRLGGNPKLVYIDDVVFIKEPASGPNETVILKLDDLRDKTENIAKFKSAIAVVNSRNISASIGILGRDFIGFDGRVEFSNYLRELVLMNNIEIWNHGWNHFRQIYTDFTWYEFSGPDRVHQAAYINDTQLAVNEALGINMKTFGAPFNQTDQATCDAIKDRTEIEVWFLPKSCVDGFGAITNLNERVNFEVTTADVDISHFLTFYGDEIRRDSDHIVLQGHPGAWEPEDLVDFQIILDLLISRGHTFATPYEFHLNKTL